MLVSSDNGLLLVTAGHTPGDGHRALAGADIVFIDDFQSIVPDLAGFDKAHMLETGIRVALEHQVVFQGIIQHQAVLVPILRDMADAAEIPLVDAQYRDRKHIWPHSGCHSHTSRLPFRLHCT